MALLSPQELRDHSSELSYQHTQSKNQDSRLPVNTNSHLLPISNKESKAMYHTIVTQQKNVSSVASAVTCSDMPTLTRQPKLVLTALGERPTPEKSLVKELVRLMRGRSSEITQHVRTHVSFRPFTCSAATDVPRPFVHSSITPYEQNVSLTALSQNSYFIASKNVKWGCLSYSTLLHTRLDTELSS